MGGGSRHPGFRGGFVLRGCLPSAASWQGGTALTIARLAGSGVKSPVPLQALCRPSHLHHGPSPRPAYLGCGPEPQGAGRNHLGPGITAQSCRSRLRGSDGAKPPSPKRKDCTCWHLGQQASWRVAAPEPDPQPKGSQVVSLGEPDGHPQTHTTMPDPSLPSQNERCGQR